MKRIATAIVLIGSLILAGCASKRESDYWGAVSQKVEEIQNNSDK